MTFQYWILLDGTSNFAGESGTTGLEASSIQMRSSHPNGVPLTEGEEVFARLNRDYSHLNIMVFGAGTADPRVGMFLPEASWTALSQSEQINLTYYVESFIPKVRADPGAYVDVSRQAPAYPQLPRPYGRRPGWELVHRCRSSSTPRAMG